MVVPLFEKLPAYPHHLPFLAGWLVLPFHTFPTHNSPRHLRHCGTVWWVWTLVITLRFVINIQPSSLHLRRDGVACHGLSGTDMVSSVGTGIATTTSDFLFHDDGTFGERFLRICALIGRYYQPGKKPTAPRMAHAIRHDTYRRW